ncbi:cell adhesion molecule CEACAM1-like isoform X3 [Dendrobates tinctorius]|uniref:cell adhesion molecule CEACAM1-like isoform X2 n=1 Tax=Dendrobates tinctorius TaxID=92724 RepID=UPI003CC94F0B
MGLLLWSVFLCTIGTVVTITQFNAFIGGTAYIFPNSPASPDHRIDWNVDAAGTVIATLLPSSSPTYAGRCNEGKCTLFINGTLQMDQLISSDNRSYSASFQAGGLLIKEQVELYVYNLLAPPTLIASSSIRPVDGTTLNLRCNTGTQTVHRVYFYRNDELVSCSSSPHLSCSTSSDYLYFNPILSSDTGIYTCGIENPVSNSMSIGIHLDVAVHVSGVTLRSNTSGPVIAEKEAVSLVCSSHGTDVNYNWTLMELPLHQNPRYNLTNGNSTLVISPVTRNDRGAFTCRVSNYLNSQLSNPINLTWSPEGNITCGAERLAQSVQLYCLWPGGYPPAGVHLQYENTILSGSDTSTTVVPINRFPLGTQLFCTGSHAGSNQVCSLVIDIPRSYGFVNESIKAVYKGNSAVLSVTLNSGSARDAQIFPATFSWVRLGPTPSKLTMKDIIVMSNDFSSYMIILEMNEEFSGKYMCKAENTMGSNYFTFVLNVKKEETISGGAIAGIVIGSIVALALVILLFFFLFRRKQDPIHEELNDIPPSRPAPVPAPQSNPSQPSLPYDVTLSRHLTTLTRDANIYVEG